MKEKREKKIPFLLPNKKKKKKIEYRRSIKLSEGDKPERLGGEGIGERRKKREKAEAEGFT